MILCKLIYAAEPLVVAKHFEVKIAVGKLVV
jgi:hypothetical protein